MKNKTFSLTLIFTIVAFNFLIAQRPLFKKSEKVFTTTCFSDGNPMDIALFDDKVALIVQKATANGDKLTVFSNEGALLKEFEIDKMNVAAITYANSKLYVLSRNNKAFIREFDKEGICIKTHSIKNKPAGTFYGLAVIEDLCYLTIYNDETKSFGIYTYHLKTETLTFLQTKGGRLKGMCVKGSDVLLNVEPVEMAPGNTLYSMQKNGNIFDSITFPRCNGLEATTENVVTLKNASTGNATIVYVKVDSKLKRVYFEPKWRNVTLEQTFKVENNYPANLTVYFTKPTSNEYQEVTNLKTTPSLYEEKKDKYNNTWLEFKSTNLLDSQVIKLNFDIYTYDIIYTLPYNSILTSKIVENGVDYTSTTDVFDYESPAFTTLLSDYIPATDFNSNVLKLRNTLNDNITVKGGSGPESKASAFIESAVGRCYAHTITLASVLRKQNISCSAIGGINITRSITADDQKEDAAIHTWNRVYHPNGFWFDLDAVADDDDKEGKHKQNRFGYHNGDYYISFIGDYEKKDYSKNFAQRGWTRVFEYSSAEKGHKTKLKQLGLKVGVKELP